ncbi:MAG TPA: hypothetical protein DCL44_12190 [Elusimicrobia bacterium]|nr:hypothetical protein [Elusimicrobiota bacterium]
MNITYPVSKKYLLAATDALIEQRLRLRLKNNKSPFTMEQVLGKYWGDEYEPFYALYHLKGQKMTAVQQMGKVFNKVCERLGVASQQIDDGKGHKHTKYSPSEQ